MKMTVVIEFEMNDTEMSTASVERTIAAFVKHASPFNDMDVTHIEAARGDINSAFGINSAD